MVYFPHCSPSHLRKLSFLSPNIARLIGFKHLLKPAPFNIVHTHPSSHTQQFHTHKRHLPVLCSHPNGKSQNHRYLLKNNVSPYSSHADVPSPEVKRSNLEALKLELEKIGVKNITLAAGEKYRLLCPMCKGRDLEKNSKSFCLSIDKDGGYASWKCFLGKCGFKGKTKAFADSKSSDSTSNEHTQVKPIREIKDDGGSEPSEQP